MNKKSIYFSKGAIILYLVFFCTVGVFAANYKFSDTLGKYSKWVTPRKITINNTGNYTVWIDAPIGFQLTILNERTSDWAGFIVEREGFHSEVYELPSGDYSLIVDSTEFSGTFKCGVKKSS